MADGVLRGYRDGQSINDETEFSQVQMEACASIPEGFGLVTDGQAKPNDLAWHRYSRTWAHPPDREIKPRNLKGNWYAVIRKKDGS